MARTRSLAVALTALFLITVSADAWSVTLYSVRPRDTLAKIAQSHGVSVERILRVNAELQKNLNLKIGQIIIIPDRQGVVARDDDEEVPVTRATMPSVAETPIVSESRPLPVPTPVAISTDDPPAPPVEHDSVAVVNALDIQVPADRPRAHRPELASRRGRLLVRIIANARRFMGVPYVWGGTTGRGYDCSGFTMRMYQMAGVSIRRLADEQYYQGKPTKQPLPGDLVFFQTYLPGPSHVGIYLGNNLFIHASSRRGVTISSLKDKYFSRRYLGARRFF